MRSRALLAIAAMYSFSAGVVQAHHSFAAEYDANRRITLRGTIARMEWSNPHSWIHLDVHGTGGGIVQWRIETGPPNILIRRGVTRETLKPGTEVGVDGYPAKDGSPAARGLEIRMPGGRRLMLTPPGAGAP